MAEIRWKSLLRFTCVVSANPYEAKFILYSSQISLISQDAFALNRDCNIFHQTQCSFLLFYPYPFNVQRTQKMPAKPSEALSSFRNKQGNHVNF